MPSVVHVVVTDELRRHGALRLRAPRASSRLAGGAADRRRRRPRSACAGSLAGDVRWLPGATPAAGASARSARVGRHDVCHAHLTYGEAVARRDAAAFTARP